jgi:hypothetical protein
VTSVRNRIEVRTDNHRRQIGAADPAAALVSNGIDDDFKASFLHRASEETASLSVGFAEGQARYAAIFQGATLGYLGEIPFDPLSNHSHGTTEIALNFNVLSRKC